VNGSTRIFQLERNEIPEFIEMYAGAEAIEAETAKDVFDVLTKNPEDFLIAPDDEGEFEEDDFEHFLDDAPMQIQVQLAAVALAQSVQTNLISLKSGSVFLNVPFDTEADFLNSLQRNPSAKRIPEEIVTEGLRAIRKALSVR